MNISKKILVAATAVSAMMCATQASAADLYTPAPEPVSTWTGFWVGGGAGYGMVNHELSGAYGEYLSEEPFYYEEIGGSLSGIGGEGWLGRVGAGYDFQVADSFVLGIFGDYTFSDIDSTLKVGYENGKGNEVKGSEDIFSYKLKAENSWFVGGRAGWLMNRDTLLYGLVGYSDVSFKGKLSMGEYSDSYSYDNGGLTWGGGVESKVSENFSLKLEYRYQDLDKKNILSLDEADFYECGDCSYINIDTRTNIQTVVVSAQYRFNTGF